MEKRRILVLTSGTGGGHNARAYAFQSWVKNLYNSDVEVRIEQVLENSSSLTRFGVGLYNWIQRFAPILHHVYWWVVEIYGFIDSSLWAFGHLYYKKLLANFKPHLVLSVHDATNGAFFRLAKHVLKPTNVQCVTYCGEFAGGYGYSRHWISPCADLFYSRTGNAQQYAFARGLRPANAKVFQNLFPPWVYSAKNHASASREEFRSEQLGLKSDRFTILLATGTVGANSHPRLLQVLLRFANSVQAIVVCGKNRAIFNKLLKWKQKNTQLGLYLESYSTEMHKLIQVSDTIVMQGGSNTASEALFFGCPIIFNCIGSIMPQEQLTMRYFIHHNAAVKIKNQQDFNRVISDWNNFSRGYRQIQKNLRALQTDDSPSVLTNQIIDLANTVKYHKSN